MKPIERFYSKVDQTGNCWLWAGATNNWGYGYFKVERKGWLAHRWLYEYYFGKLSKDQLVCHLCDKPNCVKLSHLFIGTHQDNMRDASRKGRSASLKGIKNNNNRYTLETVLKIRSLWLKKEMTIAQLAVKFKMSTSNVNHIIKRRSWAWC